MRAVNRVGVTCQMRSAWGGIEDGFTEATSKRTSSFLGGDWAVSVTATSNMLTPITAWRVIPRPFRRPALPHSRREC